MQTSQETESLVSLRAYPGEVAESVRAISPLAVQIANRWMLGWPERVRALLASGAYLEALRSQERTEREVLSIAIGAGHLARHELMEEYGLSSEPPW